MKKLAVSLIALVLVAIAACSSFSDTTCTVSAKADQSATLMKRYKKLVKKCKKKYPCDGTQYEMNRDASSQYSAWDKELNYVYSKIFKSLSASRKKELKKSQISWIRKKQGERGTMERRQRRTYDLLPFSCLIHSKTCTLAHSKLRIMKNKSLP